MILIFIGFWLFLVESGDRLVRTCSSALSHSTDNGIGVDLVLSCGCEAGRAELDELDEKDVVDEPGTTIGT